MGKSRQWADPVDPKQAERLFGRFVRHVTRLQRDGTSEGRDDATRRVASPILPPRRSDEETATIRNVFESPNMEEVRSRRLLGKDDLDQTLDATDRKKLLVELKALYRHGHVDNVVAEMERVQSKYPLDAELLGSLADFFLERGDLPRTTELLFSMVNVHFENADVAAAKRCLNRVKVLDPENQRLQKYRKFLPGM
jgi:thioredoxin-like negative regulator of GroEL